MRKPAKSTKTMRKSKERAPADQHMWPTMCDFCKKQFPDPTTARIHMDQDHADAYAT